MSAHELVYLAPSPFSHRARWALDAAGVTYTMSPYPFTTFYILEVPLRWRIGNLTGKMTSPILITAAGGAKKSQVIMDSTEIASWAQQQGSSSTVAGAALFPQGAEEEVTRWVTAADQTVSLLRKGLAAAGSSNPSVIAALLPPGSSGISAAVGNYMMTRTFKKVGAKYGLEDGKVEQDKVLSELRAAQKQIESNPNRLLLAASTAPSWADITLATTFNWLAGWAKIPLPAAAAAASSKDAADAATQQQTVADAVPEFQLVLKEFGGLLTWSAELARKHWPAAAEVYRR